MATAIFQDGGRKPEVVAATRFHVARAVSRLIWTMSLDEVEKAVRRHFPRWRSKIALMRFYVARAVSQLLGTP